MKRVYLDYAAASPVSSQVLKTMMPFFSEDFYNPSALYEGARNVKNALDEARASVARNIGARPSEITFTAGGTESANLAIKGIMDLYPGAELIISAVEHDAVRESAKKCKFYECPVDSFGRIKIAKLQEQISDKTVLISCMYANNEVGTVQPIKEIVLFAKKVLVDRRSRGVALPLFVHTDACQAPQYLDINIARIGVDLMTLNGGKIYGPKQSGILYHRSGVNMSPQILGGGQEFGIRSGTENVAFAVGFAKALELALKYRGTTVKKVSELSNYFSEMLESRFGAKINGHKKQRLPANIHVTFSGKDNERILFSLDDQGIAAASGSACSASSDQASHVLMAMGFSEKDARSSLRFSISKETTKEEIDLTLDSIEIALKA